MTFILKDFFILVVFGMQFLDARNSLVSFGDILNKIKFYFENVSHQFTICTMGKINHQVYLVFPEKYLIWQNNHTGKMQALMFEIFIIVHLILQYVLLWCDKVDQQRNTT